MVSPSLPLLTRLSPAALPGSPGQPTSDAAAVSELWAIALDSVAPPSFVSQSRPSTTAEITDRPTDDDLERQQRLTEHERDGSTIWQTESLMTETSRPHHRSAAISSFPRNADRTLIFLSLSLSLSLSLYAICVVLPHTVTLESCWCRYTRTDEGKMTMSCRLMVASYKKKKTLTRSYFCIYTVKR